MNLTGKISLFLVAAGHEAETFILGRWPNKQQKAAGGMVMPRDTHLKFILWNGMTIQSDSDEPSKG
ncbi:MAG: hypothetical protein HGA62_07635 [Chlorobiaceae bacterium]|nr:hypothetical protein [Chlorobiaceae bacterium]NTV61778.1 hypothetical protein [Chlorobiaceae bacterium]